MLEDTPSDYQIAHSTLVGESVTIVDHLSHDLLLTSIVATSLSMEVLGSFE